MRISAINLTNKPYSINFKQNRSLSSSVKFCGNDNEAEKVLSYKAQAGNIFGDKKVFLSSDYDKLTKNQKVILRKCAKKMYVLKDYRLLNFSYKQFKKGIEKEFPNGYTLVSVGRSPARYVRMFELEGYDVKYCPSISLQAGFSFVSKNKEYLKSYEHYLDSIGISAQKVKEANKPFVFVDYTISGCSLQTFRKLLKSFGIGGKNVFFRSVNDDFWDLKNEAKSPFEHVKKSFMGEAFDGLFFSEMKNYSPIQHLDAKKSWKKNEVTRSINAYREPFESKLMSFVFLDKKQGRNFFKKMLLFK